MEDIVAGLWLKGRNASLAKVHLSASLPVQAVIKGKERYLADFWLVVLDTFNLFHFFSNRNSHK